MIVRMVMRKDKEEGNGRGGDVLPKMVI